VLEVVYVVWGHYPQKAPVSLYYASTLRIAEKYRDGVADLLEYKSLSITCETIDGDY